MRAGIAQRVGTGLRPGKLRKKALSEDNKDSELARSIDQVGRIQYCLYVKALFSGPGVASNPRKFMG